MLSADFWQDKNNSQRVIKEKKFYEDLTNSLKKNVEKLKDLDPIKVFYLAVIGIMTIVLIILINSNSLPSLCYRKKMYLYSRWNKSIKLVLVL